MKYFKWIKLGLLCAILTLSCSKDEEKTDKNVSIQTIDVQVISYKTVKSGGIIESSGSQVIQRGVCYAESHQPTLANQITKDGTGLGSFNSNISQLKPNTTYYLRAYMVNSSGTYYGNEQTFKTPDFPTVNIWKLNDQNFVINEQALAPQFFWETSTSSYIGKDDSANEINLLGLGFKSRPTMPGTYALVNKKVENLEDMECNLKMNLTRKNYVGEFKYASANPHNVQVSFESGKIRIIIPETNVYLSSDSTLNNSIKFSANLREI